MHQNEKMFLVSTGDVLFRRLSKGRLGTTQTILQTLNLFVSKRTQKANEQGNQIIKCKLIKHTNLLWSTYSNGYIARSLEITKLYKYI